MRGNRRLAVSKGRSQDGAVAGVETCEREKTGHRVRRQLHYTSKLRGAIYKDGEGGSVGLTA